MQVARAADLGSNDRVLNARSHLGALLHSGDTALGYDLYSANLNDSELEKAVQRGLTLPDVILVSQLHRHPASNDDVVVPLQYCRPSSA